jgi:hypothetical protein
MDADFRGREDFQLLNKIAKEMPGIFNLVIAEAPALLDSNGSFAYNRPDDVYIDQDLFILKSFIGQLKNIKTTEALEFGDFYEKYLHFCAMESRKALGKSKVSMLLNEIDCGAKSFKGTGNKAMVKVS